MAKSPDAFRTISEVAEWLETQPHVLRFWESKFTQVKPVKRAGGRRYYRPGDMLLLGGIKKLLHDDGMTIKGVQKILREQGIRHVSGMSAPVDGLDGGEAGIADLAGVGTTVPAEAEDTGTILPFQGRAERDAAKDDNSRGPDRKSAPAAEATIPGAPTEELSALTQDEQQDVDADQARTSEPEKSAGPASDTAPDSSPDTASASPSKTARPNAPETEDMPSFIRRSTGPAPTEPEGAETAENATTKPASEASEPSSLPDPAAQTPTETPAETLAETPAETPAETLAPTAPEQPRPLQVKLPDDPDDSVAAASGLLGDIAKTGPLAPGSLGEIAKLVDRLDAWRDTYTQHSAE